MDDFRTAGSRRVVRITFGRSPNDDSTESPQSETCFRTPQEQKAVCPTPYPPRQLLLFGSQDDLSSAAKEAVRDYVELRGLKGLCPDVRKWSPPPGPSAFLDAGLPKTTGTGSLPVGLSANCIPVGGAGQGREPWCRKTDDKSAGGRGSMGSSTSGRENRSGKSSSNLCQGRERASVSRLGRYKRRSSFDSVNSGVPSPTWEAEGPEGFVSQVNRVDYYELRLP